MLTLIITQNLNLATFQSHTI